MNEYIIHVKDAETLYNLTDFDFPLEAYLREEIVRCRDCKRFHTNTNGFDCPKLEPDGFCAWGERLLTCHCGEELETEGVCPSCGRYVRRES